MEGRWSETQVCFLLVVSLQLKSGANTRRRSTRLTHTPSNSNRGTHNLASPALLNRSSLFMYIVKLLTALCRVLFISSLTGTPLSLLDVT